MTIKQDCYVKFMSARKHFDKMLKKAERIYSTEFLQNIEHLNKNNPKKFWNKLRNLGPSKENLLPNKVYKNGVIVIDTEEVLDQWKNDQWNSTGNSSFINF